MSEPDVLARVGAEKAATEGADLSTSPKPAADPEVNNAARKLRVCLGNLDFTMDWRKRGMLDVLKAALAETSVVGEPAALAQLETTVRSLTKLMQAASSEAGASNALSRVCEKVVAPPAAYRSDLMRSAMLLVRWSHR